VSSQFIFAQNPILPIGTYVADPSAKVWEDGRLYIYGSRDESLDYWCSYDHYVVSTDDMIHWQMDKDAFYSKGKNDEVPYNEKVLYAPDCQFFDGKYYLYFSQPDPKFPEGVAVSDRPEGPFKNGKAIDLKGYNQIDPSVFVDDDGQAYYLWGQFTMKMAKLNPDRTSLDENTLRDSILTESEHYFHEGAYLTKREGIYYLVYADMSRAGMPTCIGYATSKSVFGPYKYGGVIVDNDHCDPGVWNNHGSIAELNNQWYVFYHRSSHGAAKMRRSCVEPIQFNEDGSIPEVEMTSQGAGSPLNAFKDIEAERACLLYGNARLQLWNPTNEELAGMESGDRAAYKFIDFGFGEAKTVEFVVKPGISAGKIMVNIGKSWHQNIAVVSIPAKKGDEEWITVSADLKEVTGVHELWLTFQGSNGGMYSIDKFIFTK
jgi:hypothetical protein